MSVNTSNMTLTKGKARHLRLQPDNVTEQNALVAAARAHLPCAVDHINASQPLVHGQVNFTRKVVNVLDQRHHDGAQSRRRVGAHGLNDMVGEVLAKRRAVLLGGHCAFSWLVLCFERDDISRCMEERFLSLPAFK